MTAPEHDTLETPPTTPRTRRASSRPLDSLALIDFGDAAPAMHCRVRDATPDGVTIEVGARKLIPDAFTLLFAGGDGTERRCRVIWRRGVQIGVRFDGPATAAVVEHEPKQPAEQSPPQLAQWSVEAGTVELDI